MPPALGNNALLDCQSYSGQSLLPGARGSIYLSIYFFSSQGKILIVLSGAVYGCWIVPLGPGSLVN